MTSMGLEMALTALEMACSMALEMTRKTTLEMACSQPLQQFVSAEPKSAGLRSGASPNRCDGVHRAVTVAPAALQLCCMGAEPEALC